jgi:hypothetical protein
VPQPFLCQTVWLSSTTLILDSLLPAVFGRWALLTAFPTVAAITLRKGLRSGASPSDVIGMQGVVRLIKMLNRFAFGAWGVGMPEPTAEGVDVAPVASVGHAGTS